MAEAINIDLTAAKADRYRQTLESLEAVLEGEGNLTARMATVSCLLSGAFPETYFWTGFYIVDPEKPAELVVGPYQGTLGCLRIPFGRGVCGTAAAERRTQIVEDVHAIANHIACDSRSQSEIVVPVTDAEGRLIAVFDVDSTELASFDSIDQLWLELIMSRIFGPGRTS